MPGSLSYERDPLVQCIWKELWSPLTPQERRLSAPSELADLGKTLRTRAAELASTVILLSYLGVFASICYVESVPYVFLKAKAAATLTRELPSQSPVGNPGLSVSAAFRLQTSNKDAVIHKPGRDGSSVTREPTQMDSSMEKCQQFHSQEHFHTLPDGGNDGYDDDKRRGDVNVDKGDDFSQYNDHRGKYSDETCHRTLLQMTDGSSQTGSHTSQQALCHTQAGAQVFGHATWTHAYKQRNAHHSHDWGMVPVWDHYSDDRRKGKSSLPQLLKDKSHNKSRPIAGTGAPPTRKTKR
ncbi:hypothetical protein JOB18_048253 [Solea senegalensis]|uniref:Uncharacterized protein n=1 Tax=Solea senegalensis TaxID=28829 RepID=A0AAV6SEG2_SOLSE|nr:hypothetical protein JOB18_048253 [Solea senegalensis]